MYKPLSKYEKEQLDKTTKYRLTTSEGSGLTEQVFIPYTFTAVMKDHLTLLCEDWSLYNVRLTIRPALITVEDIKYTKFLLNMLSDGLSDDMSYAKYFFGAFLNELRKLANMTISNRILIKTTLPYAPEVLVDKDYKLRANENHNPTIYRGMWSRILEKEDK